MVVPIFINRSSDNLCSPEQPASAVVEAGVYSIGTRYFVCVYAAYVQYSAVVYFTLFYIFPTIFFMLVGGSIVACSLGHREGEDWMPPEGCFSASLAGMYEWPQPIGSMVGRVWQTLRKAFFFFFFFLGVGRNIEPQKSPGRASKKMLKCNVSSM